ncbi:MAG: transposase [Microcoleus anatoxicus]|uniref:RNA-guided endonuclease InsQ/TnpB family protein n=1 Tax=Microcoleus anatoxicus TaxID=2705319 RepID=UPI003672DF80
MFGCQQNLIRADSEIKAILEYLSSESAKLSNCGIYYARQLYFKTGKVPNRAQLHKVLGTENQNRHYQAFYSDTAQQILTGVAESFKSFLGLMKAFKNGIIIDRPKLPKYRQGPMAVVTFTGRSVKLKDGMLRFPLGSKVKVWFGLDAFYLPMPSNLDFKAIREYRILPRNGCFYLEFVYKTTEIQSDVDIARCLMIDHGVDNWLACMSNVGTSFIIDGKHLKSLNQGYNKQVAFLMKGKSNGFWSKKLASVTEKRNRQMRDAVNKAAKRVINHCLSNQIGTIVFGWNKGQKQSANMVRKTNQKFVQIPTGKLKDRISQLCEQYGLRFLETEESYSSKASFVDNDLLPTFGEKPEGWLPSGKRIKRGLYRTAQGWLINADCNGCGNIGRKVAVMLGLDLSGISRGELSAPLRHKLWA